MTHQEHQPTWIVREQDMIKSKILEREQKKRNTIEYIVIVLAVVCLFVHLLGDGL
jgi:hypothetical protein